MEDTGRIMKTLKSELQVAIYGENSNDAIENELKYIIEIDKAHILMLYNQRIIDKVTAKKILHQIALLEKSNFQPLRDKKTPRGIYFLYEDYLRKSIGDEYGGMLQIGRSRNDLKATVLKIRLRKPYIDCITRLLSIITMLLQKSSEYSAVVMPIYTHYQPAVPITYGHYLSAIAEELLNIAGDMVSNEEIRKSPLGAGAVGGTTIHIDTEYTAKLLGFSETVNNSIVGVGSRKIVLDLLSEIVEIESLISRCCEDYLLWTSSDLQLINLPDNLVGGSSMMPNKRNAFLFENIRGKCSKALGAYVSAVTAMKGEPFTNSIAVGTEAVSHIWDAFKNIGDVLFILEELVASAVPNQKKMKQRAEEGFTLATEYANHLTQYWGVDFRNAHRIIGKLVKDAVETDEKFDVLINKWINNNLDSNNLRLDISSVVAKTNYGWGPGKESQEAIRERNREKLNNIENETDKLIKEWEKANNCLIRAMKRIGSD